ncbi:MULTISPECIES: N-acetylmuramoyl-L-alanine amidase [Halomonadaceae]|uniref:N-acetylmuramoyl-L-alanine amidase n=1 Tax=Halomonadaceae TaxID=28256 RepID=UPI00159A93D2|nr:MULTISPECIES: N-acetylmuramoyl-L-alanine amidase [Halomonas]QJQ94688.1 N-acetylmuramoyl-L-alanine amidase [Halomonas sp. PA5]
MKRRHITRRLSLALVGMVTLLLTACAGQFEPRGGYVVDHRHQASSHNSRIRHLVIHYTSSDEAVSLRALTGPSVSSHYLVPLPPRQLRGDPLVYQLVDESRRAWHAGASAWKQRTNINDTSIGIEIVNLGPLGTREEIPGDQLQVWASYPPRQIDAVIALAGDIVERYDIHPTNVVAHSDIAPTRKVDPGPRFPWQQLYEAGIGAWPQADTIERYHQRFTAQPPTLDEFQRALKAYGYPIETSGEYDRQTHAVLRAFQLHFRPADYRGLPDAESAAILWSLLERYHPELLPIRESR